MSWLFTFKLLLFSLLMLHVSAQDDGRCPTSFSCGELGNITFPFTVRQHPHCGILAISGCDHKNTSSPKTIQLGKTPSEQSLIVTYVDGYITTVTEEAQRKNLLSKKCEAFHNFPLPPSSPLGSFYMKYNTITMFKCNHSLSITTPKLFVKYTNTNCSGFNIYYDPQNADKPPGFKVPNSLAKCTMFHVAIRDVPTSDPFYFRSPETSIEVQLSGDCNKCFRHRGGQCQLVHGKFHCSQGSRNWFVKALVLGVGVVVTVTLLLVRNS
ncbi:LEAF RUST 10 DISEASE-RESISTANCE LOCUS RECEPTOR-LIKE PROTEIN KINASE 2.5 [Trifolium repens]|nr:LEAF RUST 10 DISEASE-RESISTANCE LOCUS RECEPTOR-LIKE PROTEIN KINASE 2.5 [Trifolium repens]